MFLNGLARGCVPADDELFFSRARGAALDERRRRARDRRADGLPPRLRRRRSARRRRSSRSTAPSRCATIRAPSPPSCTAASARRSTRSPTAPPAWSRRPAPWVEQLRGIETEKLAAEEAELTDDRAPLHPMRIYARARRACSTATRSSSATAATSSPTPAASSAPTSPAAGSTRARSAAWAPGPGYALAAKLAHPGRQVVLLLGDGAFGFGGMEFDTLARHGVNVVGVMGNNGIWALEKHPMEFLYGYSVDRRPAARDALRPARRGARRSRRARAHAGRAAARARARVRGRQAGARERAAGPEHRLPAQVESRLAAARSSRPSLDPRVKRREYCAALAPRVGPRLGSPARGGI